ncbi:MAG: PCYCGC motif-containing (lipo)protein [Chloroflexota bacterium]
MNRKLILAALPTAGLWLILMSCSPSNLPQVTQQAGPEPTVEGLPDYAYRSALALRGYQIAVRETALLAQLPCYCGCGQDPQYLNLRDCFLDDQGEFRSHGANCQVCLEEAEDAARWKNQGLSPGEIRARIDGEYEGRGKPTDTPPVSSDTPSGSAA